MLKALRLKPEDLTYYIEIKSVILRVVKKISINVASADVGMHLCFKVILKIFCRHKY
jgi:hypothetical protein